MWLSYGYDAHDALDRCRTLREVRAKVAEANAALDRARWADTARAMLEQARWADTAGSIAAQLADPWSEVARELARGLGSGAPH